MLNRIEREYKRSVIYRDSCQPELESKSLKGGRRRRVLLKTKSFLYSPSVDLSCCCYCLATYCVVWVVFVKDGDADVNGLTCLISSSLTTPHSQMRLTKNKTNNHHNKLLSSFSTRHSKKTKMPLCHTIRMTSGGRGGG